MDRPSATIQPGKGPISSQLVTGRNRRSRSAGPVTDTAGYLLLNARGSIPQILYLTLLRTRSNSPRGANGSTECSEDWAWKLIFENPSCYYSIQGLLKIPVPPCLTFFSFSSLVARGT